jgi:hypothetical protein
VGSKDLKVFHWRVGERETTRFGVTSVDDESGAAGKMARGSMEVAREDDEGERARERIGRGERGDGAAEGGFSLQTNPHTLRNSFSRSGAWGYPTVHVHTTSQQSTGAIRRRVQEVGAKAKAQRASEFPALCFSQGDVL